MARPTEIHHAGHNDAYRHSRQMQKRHIISCGVRGAGWRQSIELRADKRTAKLSSVKVMHSQAQRRQAKVQTDFTTQCGHGRINDKSRGRGGGRGRLAAYCTPSGKDLLAVGIIVLKCHAGKQ